MKAVVRHRVFQAALLGALVFAALLAGCVTPPKASPDLLKFLDTGRTTREEVLLKLGQPSGSFEQERIFTYRIGERGEQGYYVISPKFIMPAQQASWQYVQYSLVLVFDEAGRLRKHRMVRVN